MSDLEESPKIILGTRTSIYGIPRRENGWEEFKNENLFPCWKCKKWYPWFSFSEAFEDEIDMRENGHFTCCKECKRKMCVKVISI